MSLHPERNKIRTCRRSELGYTREIQGCLYCYIFVLQILNTAIAIQKSKFSRQQDLLCQQSTQQSDSVCLLTVPEDPHHEALRSCQAPYFLMILAKMFVQKVVHTSSLLHHPITQTSSNTAVPSVLFSGLNFIDFLPHHRQDLQPVIYCSYTV